MQTNRPGRANETPATQTPPAPGRKAERAIRIKAAQLFLRQLRDCGGSWSDGQKVVSGADLEHLKAQTVDRLIRMRSSKPGTPQDASLVWHNIAQLQRMQARAARRAGGEEKGVVDRMLESLRLNAKGIDANAAARTKALRRALRRMDPERLEAETMSVRMSAQEQSFVVVARQSKDFVTRAPIEVWKGAFLPAGSAVEVRSDGTFTLPLPIGSGHMIELTASQVRRRRGRGPAASAPETESPDF